MQSADFQSDQRPARESPDQPGKVPQALRRWFVVHFWVDLTVALPLFVAPRWYLEQFGWTEVDPASARLVAAALLGIGVQSFIGRHEPREAFRAMLHVKAIWSFFAMVGLLWFQLEGGPPAGWGFVAIFAAFHLVWQYWRVQLAR